VPFTIRVRVEETDLDELEHANNQVYLRWVQEAAVAHSEAVGLGLAGYRQRGAVFVVSRHEVDYLRPALAGDELDVETRVFATGPASAQRYTTIHRVSDAELLARAVTWWAFIDLRGRRPARIPEDVRSRFTIEPMESLPGKHRRR
jgi:acyl-CoA thioester hydrolase